MEVVTTVDFDLNYLSAPSSPRRFGQCFSSAPASPNSISEFYHQFDDPPIQSRGGNCSVHDPVVSTGDGYDFDFAFDVSVVSEKDSRSADELFSGGKIRPLKPEFEEPTVKPMIASPKSPIVQGKNFLRHVLSPRRKKQREASKKETEEIKNRGNEQSIEQSPWSDQKATLTCSSSTSSSKGSSKRWSLKNLMLFRSASEGRGSDKDHLRKYAPPQPQPQPQPQPLFKKKEQSNSASFRSASDVRNASFRSTTEGTGSRRRMSAHEMHYAANRAASEDLKKRTFLPYNQGILAFSSVHGFGSLAR